MLVPRPDSDVQPAAHTVATGETKAPPSLVSSPFWVKPSTFVAVGDDGARFVIALPELNGYAVVFRNHRVVLCDHGLREALRLQTRGSAPSAFPAPIPAVGAPQPASAAAIMSVLWAGAPYHILLLVCSDRLLRVYSLAKHALQGPAPLVDVLHRRIEAIQQDTNRRAALSGAPRPATAASVQGTRSSSTSVNSPPPDDEGKSRPSQSRSRRGLAADIEDLCDLGRATDYLRLREATAVVVGSVGGPRRLGSVDGHEDDDASTPAVGISEGLEGLSLRRFIGGEQLQQHDSKRALGGALYANGAQRTIDADAAFLTDTYPNVYVPLRSLSQGVPTTGAVVNLSVIGYKGDTGVRPAGALGAPVPGSGNAAVDAQEAASASSCSAVAAIVGDNAGCVTVHAVGACPHSLQDELLGLTASGGPHLPSALAAPPPLKLPMTTVLSLVALPEQALAGEVTTTGRVVAYSSRCTVAAGGLGGPVVLLHVSLAFGASPEVQPSFRVHIFRSIATNGLTGHRLGITALTFSQREGCLITVGLDSRVLMWDASSTVASSAHVGQLGSVGLIATVRTALTSLLPITCLQFVSSIRCRTKIGLSLWIH
jgi:hypothetical protein